MTRYFSHTRHSGAQGTVLDRGSTHHMSPETALYFSLEALPRQWGSNKNQRQNMTFSDSYWIKERKTKVGEV